MSELTSQPPSRRDEQDEQKMEAPSGRSTAEHDSVSQAEQETQQKQEDASQAQVQGSDEHLPPPSACPSATPSVPGPARRGPRQARSALEPLSIILVILIVIFLRLYVYESDIVQGVSMRPSLKSGDYLLVNKLAFRKRPPERFDIVTFPDPQDQRDILIKRVIGLPGEWVHVWGTNVFINGRLLHDPYARWSIPSFKEPVWVPSKHIYVMGDNRDNSEDSREWGPVDISTLRGRAMAAYFPVDRARLLR
jgi:signal peptidase I